MHRLANYSVPPGDNATPEAFWGFLGVLGSGWML